jgi:hypothetical protein
MRLVRCLLVVAFLLPRMAFAQECITCWSKACGLNYGSAPACPAPAATEAPPAKVEPSKMPEWVMKGSGLCAGKQGRPRLCGVGVAGGPKKERAALAASNGRSELAAVLNEQLHGFFRGLEDQLSSAGGGNTGALERLRGLVVQDALAKTVVVSTYENADTRFALVALDTAVIGEKLVADAKRAGLSPDGVAAVSARLASLEGH